MSTLFFGFILLLGLILLMAAIFNANRRRQTSLHVAYVLLLMNAVLLSGGGSRYLYMYTLTETQRETALHLSLTGALIAFTAYIYVKNREG